jgi:hypothetical protein
MVLKKQNICPWHPKNYGRFEYIPRILIVIDSMEEQGNEGGKIARNAETLTFL